ncbi:hypothetical protein GGR52DRAFT_572870 [Hypoxylon sp. FL1284]|nr:hypothetical protein GGR52DRAFT_572870 [Hypoxylon sp. FL1284]
MGDQQLAFFRYFCHLGLGVEEPTSSLRWNVRPIEIDPAQFQKWLKQTSDKIRSVSAQNASLSLNNDSNQAGKGSRSNIDPKAVHWSQLEVMAQTVIDHSEPEQIPRSAISILRDVSNSAHEHIIQVLERILHRFDAFLSKVTPSTPPANTGDDGRLGMNDINNMFELLHVEQVQGAENEERGDASEAEAGVPKRVKKSQKKGGKKQKQKKQPKEQRVQKRKPKSHDASWVDTFKWVEEEEEEEEEWKEDDYYMLIYCFFQDFNFIRTYVSDRWTEYFYHKSVSPDTLAVVTNAACEMFHEMEIELVTVLCDTPQLADYDFMMQTLFFHYGLDHVDYSDEDKLTDMERKYKILSEADWLGFLGWTNIVQILLFVPPGKVPMIPASAVVHPKYGNHDFEDFRHFTKDAVFDFFPEICITKAMKTNGQLPMVVCAQDELTLDFENVFRTRGYTSATVFALSMYIDIRYILEDQVTDAFDLVQATAENTKAVLEKHIPHLKGSGMLKKECRMRMAEVESFILEDFTEEDKARRFEEKGVTEEFEKHVILKKDPIWSGLLDLRCRLVLANLGCRLVNESPVVLAAAFAYAAPSTDETSSLSWPQMDEFFQVYNRDKILKGPLPSQSVDLLKRFVDHNLATSDRPCIGSSKSLEALYGRYAWETSRPRQSMTYLGEIIRDTLDARADNVLLDGGTEVVKRGANSADEQIARRELSSVSPVQLLEILDETTTSLLENQLSVDLFQLHTESVQLLQKLVGEFSSEVESGAPFLLEENARVDKLPLLLPIIYRSMVDGDEVETSKRLGKAVGGFCSNL